MIIGAGFSGLIAAHVFQKMPIYEAMPEPRQNHNALLRFRTNKVSQLTGIDFKKVQVRKGIFYKGEFHNPNILLANLHSQKCLGEMNGDRSIWNIDPVDRYIAPENFYGMLIDSVIDRINFGQDINPFLEDFCVTTAPLNKTLELNNPNLSHPFLNTGVYCGELFNRSKITTINFKIKGVNLYQTIYYPDPETSLYRASITGNKMILEFCGEFSNTNYWNSIYDSFGIDVSACKEYSENTQNYGKIAAIDEKKRKQIIFELTNKYNIYSLGRFATWRNILLDDVVDDALVIKKIMNLSDYEKRKIQA